MSDAIESTAIRRAVASDAAEIQRMVVELAVYEREAPERVLLTEADLLRDAFGSRPACEILIAERDDGRTVGFTLFCPNYSTWEGRPGIHIEELYVRDEARGTGVGRRLMAEVAAIAAERGCPRVDLNVLNWNPAKQFYGRIGLYELDQWEHYRLEGAALAALAGEAGRKR
ncbi:MAG: GNAT family N-acetyltransferase [Rhodospirillaceae bacterium]|nr:GNAT family N-acetyltransferase [Rhodospirillaceae bacterium]